MNTANIENVLWKKGEPHAEDFIVDGKTSVYRIPVEEYMQDNPGLVLISWDEFLEVTEKIENEKFLTDWEEITEEQYTQALECLPPEKWLRYGLWSFFRMSERMISNITAHYALYNSPTCTRFFTAHRRTSQDYQEMIQEIRNQLLKTV
jgi:hypothetical protein